MFHALGVSHEHQRADQANFIEVHDDVIRDVMGDFWVQWFQPYPGNKNSGPIIYSKYLR